MVMLHVAVTEMRAVGYGLILHAGDCAHIGMCVTILPERFLVTLLRVSRFKCGSESERTNSWLYCLKCIMCIIMKSKHSTSRTLVPVQCACSMRMMRGQKNYLIIEDTGGHARRWMSQVRSSIQKARHFTALILTSEIMCEHSIVLYFRITRMYAPCSRC